MWYLFPILVALIAGLIFVFSGYSKGNRTLKTEKPAMVQLLKNGPDSATSNLGTEDSQELTTPSAEVNQSPRRQEIERLLKKLAQTPAPQDLSYGAKCYDMAAPPKKADYICPTCGFKTLYHLNMAPFIARDLPACRRILKTIPLLNLKLDESQFCKKCRPAVIKPTLCLQVFYANEPKARKLCGISRMDLQLLAEFATGRLKYKNDFGREFPLKDMIKRLQQLLVSCHL